MTESEQKEGIMDIETAVLLMARRAGLNARRLSLKMGRAESFISTTFAKGSSPKASTLVDMARACDYHLAFIPNEIERPYGSIYID